MPTHTLNVGTDDHHKRLDVFLTQAMVDIPSRSFVKKLIDQSHVRVNQNIVKAHHKVAQGDVIVVQIPQELLAPVHIVSEDIPLDIFYEDENLLVVNKKAGMVVHPSQGCYSGTLVNALLHHCQQLSDVNGSTHPDQSRGLLTIDPERRPSTPLGPSPELVEGRRRRVNTALRPGIVHRLDRETSGLLVVAKDNITHTKLAKQFQQQRVVKHYVALIDGEMEFDEGVVEAPLGRHIRDRQKRDVRFDETAKEAVTYYRVIRRFQGISLVRLSPKTGRTHQLRVHMSHIGHPILGDEKYGRKQSFPRLALHAQSLGFIHPRQKCFIEFCSQPPKEFFSAAGM